MPVLGLGVRCLEGLELCDGILRMSNRGGTGLCEGVGICRMRFGFGGFRRKLRNIYFEVRASDSWVELGPLRSRLRRGLDLRLQYGGMAMLCFRGYNL